MKIKNTILIVAGLFTIAACKKEKAETPSPVNPPVSNDITYNAGYVVNGGSNTISVIDLATNEVKRTITLPLSWPHHAYINGNKTKISIGVPGMDLSGGHSGMTGSGKFIIVDAINGNVLDTTSTQLIGHNAIFSPDGTEIWIAQHAMVGYVQVYDASTYTLKNTIYVQDMPLEVTFSADGLYAFVANSGAWSVSAINISTKAVTNISVDNEPIGAWPGSNNKMYVDNEAGQSISVIDVNSLTVEETVNLGFTPGMAAYNSMTNELWVTNGDSAKVVYFMRNGNLWQRAGEIITGNGAHAIAFTNNGMYAYITNQLQANVSVINVMSKLKVKDITVGIKPNGIVLKQ
ncbi:MAG: hypothetical protein H0W84_02505 [Bacteroidetes bacterium]|nr:hypothetical protein [Bacteroidota bacterium]